MEMEYCDRGDLYEFISTYTQHQVNLGNLNKGLLMNDLTLLKVIFYQLIDAVSSLHNKAGFAHMDIKLENILISKEGHLKLIIILDNHKPLAPGRFEQGQAAV